MFDAQDESTSSLEAASSPLSILTEAKESFLDTWNSGNDHCSVARYSSSILLNGVATAFQELGDRTSHVPLEERREATQYPKLETVVNSDGESDLNQMDMTEVISNQLKNTYPSDQMFSNRNGHSPQERTEEPEGIPAVSDDLTVPLSDASDNYQHPSKAWLALRAITHSGGGVFSLCSREADADMDLTSAIFRLERARSSINEDKLEKNFLGAKKEFTDDDGEFHFEASAPLGTNELIDFKRSLASDFPGHMKIEDDANIKFNELSQTGDEPRSR